MLVESCASSLVCELGVLRLLVNFIELPSDITLQRSDGIRIDLEIGPQAGLKDLIVLARFCRLHSSRVLGLLW